MLENTQGVMKKNNTDKLATQGSKDRGGINIREYGWGNQNESQEKLATQGTQDTAQINVR